MKIYRDIDLYSFNTMRLHSIAEVLYIPESNEELLEILEKHSSNFLLLAGGSNVILPEKVLCPVISLMSLNQHLEMLEDGRTSVGCSVRVQKLIRFLQNHNLGGIEYLYSVPASVGGLVYMNGGRGKKFNAAISDYLESVKYLDLEDMSVKTYHTNRADFSYRHSPFQEMSAIILTCYFRFANQESSLTENLINERLRYSKEYLSSDKPSCGSVFSKGNPIVYRLVRGMRVGGAMFSKKTSNWISNVDNASYLDICKLINRAKFIHKLFLSSCQTEIKIIKD